MSNRPSLYLLASLLLAGPAVAQQMAPRTPGLWQIDSKVQMLPMGMNRSDSERLCLTPEMARRDVAPPSALEADGWKCSSTMATIAKDKASYTTSCRHGGDRATGTGEVTQRDGKEFKGRTQIDANMEGMQVTVKAEYHGRFIDARCGDAPMMKWEGFAETPRK